jgi:hypothetical protein
MHRWRLGLPEQRLRGVHLRRRGNGRRLHDRQLRPELVWQRREYLRVQRIGLGVPERRLYRLYVLRHRP